MLWHHIISIQWELDGLRRDLAAAPEHAAEIKAAIEDVQRRYDETFGAPNK